MHILLWNEVLCLWMVVGILSHSFSFSCGIWHNMFHSIRAFFFSEWPFAVSKLTCGRQLVWMLLNLAKSLSLFNLVIKRLFSDSVTLPFTIRFHVFLWGNLPERRYSDIYPVRLYWWSTRRISAMKPSLESVIMFVWRRCANTFFGIEPTGREISFSRKRSLRLSIPDGILLIPRRLSHMSDLVRVCSFKIFFTNKMLESFHFV